MEEQYPGYGQEISEEDWERTPANVKLMVAELIKRIEQLERQHGELEEQNRLLQKRVKRSSANSSQLPLNGYVLL